MADQYGTPGNDTLTGGTTNDTLYGYAGNDTLDGGAGRDILMGGDGSDVMTGGSGNDQIDGGAASGVPETDVANYSGNRSDYDIVRVLTDEGRVATDTFQVTDLRPGSPDGADLVINVEVFRFADGDIPASTIGAVIIGNDETNALHGNIGPDAIFGLGSLDGLYGNGGDDQLTGGGGDDQISGGDGTDMAIFSGNRSDYTVTGIFGGDYRVVDNRSGSPDGTDLLYRGVERLGFADQTVTIAFNGITLTAPSSQDSVLTGGAGNDSLYGNYGNDVLLGGGGSDILDGSQGSDRLTGGPGNDILTGGYFMGFGPQTDVAVFSGNRSDYSFAWVRSGRGPGGAPVTTYRVTDLREGAPDGLDIVTNFADFAFADGDVAASAIGAEFVGWDWNENLGGTDGADQIFGLGGADNLTAYGGDDELTGGAGNDLLNGGDGTDVAIYSGNRSNYTVTLLAGGAIEVTDNRAGSPDGTDSLQSNIEFLRFADGLVSPDSPAPPRDRRSDFNGDGRSDVAWLHSSGQFTTWRGQPDGSFSNTEGGAPNALDASWKVVGIGDFNGDGKDDLLWRHSSGEIAQWQGRASGPFFNPNDVAANGVDNSWEVAGVADYNGDGRDDILWRHVSGEITEWLAQPDGRFTNNSSAAANAVDIHWEIVASGDYNADGAADVLWRHSSGEFAVWRGSATGKLLNAGQVLAGATGTVIGSADFNGDGRDDVLTRTADGAITQWLAQADGQFSALTPSLQIRDTAWDIVGIGDYNGDGFDDLLWRYTTGEGGEWLGTATGQFEYNNVVPTVHPTWQPQAPDLFMV